MGLYQYICGTPGMMPIINAATPLTSYNSSCDRENIMPYVESVIAAGDNDNGINNINTLGKNITETVDAVDPSRHPLPSDKSNLPATIKIECHIPGLTIYNPATRAHLPNPVTKHGGPRSGCLHALHDYHIMKKPLEAKAKRYWSRKLRISRPEGVKVGKGVFLRRLEKRLKKETTAALERRRRSVEGEWEWVWVEKEMVTAGLVDGQMDRELVEILRRKCTRRRGKRFDREGGEMMRRRVLGKGGERRRAKEV
jgi:hypothetical protein